MKTVLVTGASGFVGSHVVPALAERGYKVVGTYAHDHEKRHPKAEWRQWSLFDAEGLRQIVSDFAPIGVIHLASPSNVQAANADPAGTIDTIFRASVGIAEVIGKSPSVERFVYASSAQVYAPPRDATTPMAEDYPQVPRSMYGICKMAAAQWFQCSLRDRAVILRPFNQIGPGQAQGFAVSSLARQVAEVKAGRQSVITAGNLDVVRDWIDVREAAVAHIAALERGKVGEAYNLCSGRGTSLRQLLQAMMASAGVSVNVETDPARLRSDDVPWFVGDPRKLEQATGWKSTGEATAAAVAAVQDAITNK